MSRRLRRYYLQEETGIVYRSFFFFNQSPGSPGSVPGGPTTTTSGAGPSYDTVWLDRNDHTIWQVDFNVIPATVTQTTGNNIDGWVLNGGYFIYIDTHQLRVSNNAALLTPRFRNVPTSVTEPLSVSIVTGELLHGA